MTLVEECVSLKSKTQFVHFSLNDFSAGSHLYWITYIYIFGICGYIILISFQKKTAHKSRMWGL